MAELKKEQFVSLISYISDYEATVRTLAPVGFSSSDVESFLARESGGYQFNKSQEYDFYETPPLSLEDARSCLDNLS